MTRDEKPAETEMSLFPGFACELPAAASVERKSARSWRRLSQDIALVIAGFPCYGVLALGVSLACLVAAVVTGGQTRKRVCQGIIHRGVAAWAWIMEKTGVYRVDFDPRDVAALRALRGAVIAPNHPCLLDATLFLARLPQLTCLMKRSILDNPFMGISSRLSGYLRNDHGAEFIRQGRDALRAGENLLIFPEGTRTVQAPVNSFKKGFALIATLAEAPVQTVFISMPVLFLGKRWQLWRIPVLPVRITVRLGRQFQAGTGQTAKGLGAELEGYFRAHLEPDGGGVRQKDEPQPLVTKGGMALRAGP
jgi:1-acyl-sn-glycerol-3-phosphate acyltransferase